MKRGGAVLRTLLNTMHRGQWKQTRQNIQTHLNSFTQILFFKLQRQKRKQMSYIWKKRRQPLPVLQAHSQGKGCNNTLISGI